MNYAKLSLRSQGIFCLSTCLVQACLSAEQLSTPMPPLAEASPIRIVEGPILLHANAAGEWGGHTFSYVLLGEKYVFWAAMLYEPGRTSRTMLLGQYPREGIDKPPVVTSISLDASDFYNSSLPLLVRTPDGFIHVFVGVTHDIGKPNLKPGVLRHFRGAA